MGFTKDHLHAHLQELRIGFPRYEHLVVLTVEDGAKCVGYLKGGLSKILFLKALRQKGDKLVARWQSTAHGWSLYCGASEPRDDEFGER